MSGWASALPLSLLGLVLAAVSAVAVARLASRVRDPVLIRLLFLAGLLAACLLPFGWVAVVGRAGL